MEIPPGRYLVKITLTTKAMLEASLRGRRLFDLSVYFIMIDIEDPEATAAAEKKKVDDAKAAEALKLAAAKYVIKNSLSPLEQARESRIA